MDADRWIEGYLDDLRARGFSATTIRDRRYPLRFFWKWLSGRHLRLDQLDAALVHEYLLLRSKGRAPSTLAGNLDVLRDFMRYALKRGAITNNPTDGVSCRWLNVPGGYPAYRGILRELFGSKPAAAAKGRLPLFSPHWESYLRHLRHVGYSRGHIVRTINCVSRFHEFVRRRGLRFRELRPEHVSEFLAQKDRLRSHFTGRLFKQKFFENSRRSIGSFLTYALGWKTTPATPSKCDSRVLPERLWTTYAGFCRRHRGLKPSTLARRAIMLGEFGAFIDRRGLGDISNLGVRDIDAFLLSISDRMKPVSLRSFVSTLRSFLRFLFLRRILASDLSRHIVSPRRFRRELRPKYLPWNKVLELLARVDRTSLIGKRDYAILVLLAGHGVRNHDVGSLLLSDVDWQAGSLLLRERKGGYTQTIPAARHVLDALREYLAVRPAVDQPHVFLTVAAPIRPLGDNVQAVVQHHLRRRFGDSLPHYGAHVLRHSFAKALLDQGAKMTDVRDLLGHHSLESTHVYTGIATNDLGEVADNYASLLSPAEAA